MLGLLDRMVTERLCRIVLNLGSSGVRDWQQAAQRIRQEMNVNLQTVIAGYRSRQESV